MTGGTKQIDKPNYTLNDFLFLSNSVIPPTNSNSNISSIIADTGCTGHYAGTQKCKTNTHVKPITVTLPNGERMTSTRMRHLHIPSLPPEACSQHLFPDMKTSGLLSIGQLCDAGCTAQFTQTTLEVRNKHGEVIIIGKRNHIHGNKMWVVHMSNNKPVMPASNSCNAIVLSDTTKKDLAKLHHASLGFPVKSTLIDAIDKGFLSTFPGLNENISVQTSFED